MNAMDIREPVTLYGGMADGKRIMIHAGCLAVCIPILDGVLMSPVEQSYNVELSQCYRRRSSPGPDGYAAYDYESSSPIMYWTEG